jgi:histidinol-phosphate aminotransferase
MLATVNDRTKLLFICSPGNPTCKAIDLNVIEEVASSTAYNGIVVVDEAYVDFSTKGSAVSLIQKYPNIVVLQTLSKAFGLAGIRCGFCLGPPDVIQLMNNVKAPYNINKLTTEVALNALDRVDVLERHVRTILEQREMVRAALEELDLVLKVYPSDSNFLLFRVKGHAKEIYKIVSTMTVRW